MVSFSGAMKKYFGYKEGETLADFARELRALNLGEKKWFANELRKIGVDCEDPIEKLEEKTVQP